MPEAALALLDTAAVGRPLTRAGVSFFPLYVQDGAAPDIATGPDCGVEISEQANAEVPTLVAHNPTSRAVLLVAGETVVGGRQNRVLNVSVLIGAGALLTVPVSCVEQGRWHDAGAFGLGSSYAPRRVRRTKVATVADNVRRSGSKYTDQGLVWDAVDVELGRLGVSSPSHALHAGEGHIDQVRHLRDARDELVGLGPLPGQCGMVVAHGRRVVSVEVFASDELLRAHWPALVTGCLLDVPELEPADPHGRGRPSASTALAFLHRLATATPVVTPGVGLGRECHVRSSGVVAQALVLDSAVVHANAFALAA